MTNYTINSSNLFYTLSKFSSGEQHVTVVGAPATPITIKGSVTSSDHIMELLLLVDALQRMGHTDLHLIMPYMAYGRQDRVCLPGEPLSIKVMATLINSCNFVSVTTYNNHSDVTTALIDRCNNVTNVGIIEKHRHLFTGYDYVLSPDAGAVKETFKVAQLLGIPMLRADKSRDLKTGAITGTEVFAPQDGLANKKVLIVDDIVAGGRTCVEISKRLHEISNNVKVTLFITHGFFDHGLHALTLSGIPSFITTDSVYTGSFVAVEVIDL